MFQSFRKLTLCAALLATLFVSACANTNMGNKEMGGTAIGAIAGGLAGAAAPYMMMGRKVLERLPDAARQTISALDDQEAKALLQASVNPNGQAEMVRILSPRVGNRQRARNLARVIRYYASQRSGEMAAGDQ